MTDSKPEAHGATAYVSRAGLKLRHALEEFRLDPAALICADFGCNVGGFTDCLLRAGAARVFAIDTGYGALAWTLRNDPRIVVMERTNALHAPPPPDVIAAGGLDLVVTDLGWTPQRLAIPAALRWLKPSPTARIVTLIKPHYEATDALRHGAQPLIADAAKFLVDGVLDDETAQRVAHAINDDFPSLGARSLGLTRSPLRGGETKGNKRGNAEWLALLARA